MARPLWKNIYIYIETFPTIDFFFQLILFLRFRLDSDTVFDVPDELDCAAAKYTGTKIRLWFLIFQHPPKKAVKVSKNLSFVVNEIFPSFLILASSVEQHEISAKGKGKG